MRRRHDDSGSALLMVLGAMTVLMIIVSVAASAAMQTAAFSRHSSDWNQALAAAEAGVDDYLARLNRDDGYWRTTDCTNVAVRRPNAGVCGWGSSTTPGWVNVPLSPRAQFHYDVVTTSTATNGTITLTSTGQVGAVKRTVQTILRRGGFGEFLYYTVYETTDPANESVYSNTTTAQAKCAHYAWEPDNPPASKPRDQSYCSNIQFVTGDVINGPVHSNDTILMNGTPVFQGAVSTSDPACQPGTDHQPKPASACYKAANGSTAPRFDKGIAYRSEIALPGSIGDLKQYVSPVTTTSGCLYTGPTRIRILAPSPSSAYSKMKVWSPYTTTGTTARCGGTKPKGVTVDVPNNNLILVQKVPSTQSHVSGPCASGFIGDGLPQQDDDNQNLSEADCGEGTLYVQGTLHGRVTMSAESNIVITGDLKYADGKTGLDSLGLIAENSVEIYHPIKATCTKTRTASARNTPTTSCRFRRAGRPGRPSRTRRCRPRS